MNDLELLLKEKEETKIKTSMPTFIDNCEIPHGGTAVNMQRANKDASLYDFLDMLALITDYSMKKHGVEFVTEDKEHKLTDPEIPFNHPYISYRLISRRPMKEYKPIAREEIVECDEHNKQRFGTVYGQKFDCIVQFNVFASENRVANKVMESFEELMISYAGYFKEQGVRDLYFKEQVTDTDYNNFRETLSVRNIRYYVQIEKLMVIFNRSISDVETSGEIN
ncbi:MAG: hypothetical protein RR406_00315 [Bacilli bacterium]